MTDRTWVGGGDNNAYDPNNWSPAGAPQPGDTLYLINGTANVQGGDLNGSTLDMGFYSRYTPPQPALAAPVLNVSSGANLHVNVSSTWGTPNTSTINVKGWDSLNVSADTSTHFGPASLGINLDYAILFGSVSVSNEHVAIGGAGILVNTGSSVTDGGSLAITSDMLGPGTTSLGFLGNVELGRLVSFGQTFSLDGVGSTLTIDDPGRFYGLVTGPSDSTYQDNQVNLTGVHADSYALANDMLTLYDGDRLVAGLRFHDTAASTFVGQGPSGVIIGMNLSAQPSGVLALPQHIDGSV